jgi:hypothetical protein
MGKGGGEDATIGTRIHMPREQLVATLVVVVIFNNNARGGKAVVLMEGCLVGFMKGFHNLENIGVFFVLLLSVPKKLYVESHTHTYHRCIPPEPKTTLDSLSTMVVVNLYDNILPDPTSITSPQRLISCKLAGSSPQLGTQIGRKSKSASLRIGRKERQKKLQTSRLAACRFGNLRHRNR